MTPLRLAFPLAAVLATAAPAAAPDMAPALPAPMARAPIPEKPLQIRPTAYFFTLKSPADFLVARPDSFDDYDHFKISDLFYSIDDEVETVFARYREINPLKIWSTKRAKIQAAYVPSTGETLDRAAMAAGWPGFEEGMKIFVDMSSLPWAVSNKPAMMVALKIVRIDDAAREVVFRYLEGTPSYGEQRMRFTADPANPGVTKVSHRTWFRSYGKLVERMYPVYHRKMINEMHARFKWEIES